jgi:hypothetical protein
MANNFFGAIGLTGGGAGALDAIDGAIIADGDAALVIDSTNDKTYFYTLNSSSGAAESSPTVISPDSNAGTKRWILTSINMVVSGSLNATVDRLTANDMTLSAGAQIIYTSPTSDETGTGVQIAQTVDANTYGVASLLVLSADGNWDEADADSEDTVGRLALAMQSGTGTKRVMLRGIMRDDTWNFTPGAQLYVSTTVGEITQTAPSASGDFVQVVGYALTADIILFDPSPDYVELA